MAAAGSPGSTDQPDVSYIFDAGQIGQVLLGLGSATEFLMLAATAARLYTKQHILRRWTPDDYTCIVAATATTAYFITSCYIVTKAASDSVAAGQASTDFLIVNWLTQWLSPLSFVFVKLSFFLLYFQIFRPIRSLRIAALVGAIYSSLFWGFLLFFRLGMATPAPGQSWDVVESARGSYANHLLVVIAGPIDIVSNIHILVLPVLGISKLELSVKKKAGVIAVIMTSLLALVASIISMAYRVGYAAESRAQSAWYANTVCCVVELQIGIFCCSMPAFSALLRHHFSALDFAASQIPHQHHSRPFYTDISGKPSGSQPGARAAAAGIIDDDLRWSVGVPPLPDRAHTVARKAGAASPTPSSIEMDEISLDSAGRTRQQQQQRRHHSYDVYQQYQHYQQHQQPQGQQSPTRRSRPTSLLLSILPASAQPSPRPSPRPSRTSSLRRSASPWGVRGLLEPSRDPHAALGDKILVETDIQVTEEEEEPPREASAGADREREAEWESRRELMRRSAP